MCIRDRPYSATDEIDTLEPEVSRHEPRLALDGGPDGLDAYRVLAGEALRVLKPDGHLAFEIGHTQADAVVSILQAAGAEDIRVHRDLAQRDRVVSAAKKPLGNPFPNR